MADQNTPPPAAAGSGKNPLDILEEILNESEKGATAQPAAAAAAAPAEPADAAAGAAEDEAQAAAESARLAEEREVRRIQEEKEIQQRVQDLQTIQDSPEYLAAVDQKQQAEQAASDYQAKMDGTEIVQISHTKIQLD